MAAYGVRVVGRVIAGAVLLVVLLYGMDWLRWKINVSHGAGLASLSVSQVTVAALKGGKEAYYSDGTTTVLCSRSLFPQGGNPACWWMKRYRHAVVNE